VRPATKQTSKGQNKENISRLNLIGAALACALAFLTTTVHAAGPLPRRNDNKAKQSIGEFVVKVSEHGLPDFDLSAEPIARAPKSQS
jgi:hypothetical protein